MHLGIALHRTLVESAGDVGGRSTGASGRGNAAGWSAYSTNAKDNLASGRLRKGKSPSAAAHWEQGRLAESGSNDGWLGCRRRREPPSRAAAKSAVVRIHPTSLPAREA